MINQYQSAKWGIALTGPGNATGESGLTGAEAQAAMASTQAGATTDGYSVFAATYLNRLSQTSNIILQASNNINLDLQGNTLSLAAGKNITLTAGNQILTDSTGTITTSQSSGSGGIITMNATNGILFNNAFTLNSGGGAINLNNAVTLGAPLAINSGSGTVTFASTVNGTNNLTAAAGTFSFASALGGGTPLSAVSLTSANSLTLPSINAASIFAQTTGASADIIIPNNDTLTASGSGNAIVLASGHNFTNNYNSSALSAGSGRWVIYSTSSAADAAGGGVLPSHTSQTYNSLAPSAITTPTYNASQNTWVYSSAAPGGTLTFTADSLSRTYGSSNPTFTYSFSCSTGCNEVDAVTGTPSLSTAAGAFSSVAGGPYTITIAMGSLALTGGYSGYTFSFVNGLLTILQKAIDITSLIGVDKVYDRTTTASLSGSASLSGVVNSDDVSLTGSASGTFANADVGTGKTVTVSGLSLTGAAAGNYSLNPYTTTANITQRALTVTADAQSATYGDTLGTLTYSESGLLGGDSLTGTLTTAHGGAGTVLSHTDGFDVSGSPYAITQGTLANADYAFTYNSAGLTLTPKGLSITGFAAADKTYDGTVAAAITSDGSLVGALGADAVSINDTSATATFDTKHVGTTHTVTAAGYTLAGAQAGDYSLSAQPATGANVTISQKALTVTADAQSATYGDTLGTLTYSESGLLGGDSLTGTLTTAHGGAGTVLSHTDGFDVSGSPYAITQGTLANADYAFTYNSAGLTLTPKGLSITGFAAADKTYDGTVAAAITSDGSLVGALGADAVSINDTSATATFDTKHVGTTHTVTAAGYTLAGAQAGDYSLSAQPATGANVTISQKALTVTADAQSATYGDTLEGTLTYSESGAARRRQPHRHADHRPHGEKRAPCSPTRQVRRLGQPLRHYPGHAGQRRLRVHL